MLDSEAYPHILDEIVEYAPPAALRSLRSTSRALRTKADAHLCDHLVLKDGDSCAMDALTVWSPPSPPTADSTSSEIVIVRPTTRTGMALVPPDERLDQVRVLDIHSPTQCTCERCEGMSWRDTLLRARIHALVALSSGPTPVRDLRLLRFFGDQWGPLELPAEVGVLAPTRVVHFSALSPEPGPARNLNFEAFVCLGTDVVLNFRYSLDDEGFPCAHFYTPRSPRGRTIFILFTRTEGQWTDHFPMRRVNQPRVLNHLAQHVAVVLRVNTETADRVVIVGMEGYDPEWIGSVWGDRRDGLPEDASVEERFRWWVRACAYERDADRVEAGIAYATLEEFKAYIGNEVEYALIMNP
jgi:hypothetical protein